MLVLPDEALENQPKNWPYRDTGNRDPPSVVKGLSVEYGT